MFESIIQTYSLVRRVLCHNRSFVKRFPIWILYTGYQSNFNYYNNTYADTLNTSYDYSSVMHYGEDAFSANGFATIEALQNVSFGSSNISATDILATRIFYNCSASGTPLPSIPAVTLR